MYTMHHENISIKVNFQSNHLSQHLRFGTYHINKLAMKAQVSLGKCMDTQERTYTNYGCRKIYRPRIRSLVPLDMSAWGFLIVIGGFFAHMRLSKSHVLEVRPPAKTV